MADETHTIRERFVVEDHGSAAVEKIGHAFEHAAEHGRELKERVGEFRREIGLSAPALLGIGAGLGAWVEKTKEVARETDIAKRQLTGFFSTSLNWDKHTSFVDRYNASAKIASEQFEKLDEVAGRFGGSGAQVVDNYKQIGQALGGLGLSRDQLTELTERVRATSKVLGVESGQLIEKIANAALFKQVARRGEAGKFLAQALGGKTDLRGTQFEILERINKAMERLVPTADKMSQGVDDSLNRLHLAVEDIFRAVSTPLFNEVGKTLSDWAKRLNEARDGVKPLAEVYGEKLVRWFREAKDVTGELLSHWKEIAVVWAGFKVGGMLGGIGKGLGGLAEGGGMLGGAAGALGKFAGQLGVAAGALSLFYVGVKELADWIDREQSKRMRTAAPTAGGGGTILAAAEALRAGRLGVARGNLAGISTLPGGGLDVGALTAVLKASQSSDLAKIAAAVGVKEQGFDLTRGKFGGFDADAVARAFAAQFSRLQGPAATPFATYGPSLPEGGVTTKAPERFAKQITNFNIASLHVEQKFEDTDPDRVFLRFKQDLEDQVVRPAVSIHAEPLGQ